MVMQEITQGGHAVALAPGQCNLQSGHLPASCSLAAALCMCEICPSKHVCCMTGIGTSWHIGLAQHKAFSDADMLRYLLTTGNIGAI